MPLKGLARLTDSMGPRMVNFYALADDGGCTLFDAGLPGSVQSRIATGKIPTPVTRMVISHADADHLGDAGSLREAEILCHALDRDWIEDHDALVDERYRPIYGTESLPTLREMCGPNFMVNRTLEDGEALRIGAFAWRVLHVPGHTHGHIALWREEDGVLLIGDAVLGFAVPNQHGQPSMPPTHGYIAEYLSTIERFQGVPVSTVLSGHWPPLDAGQFRSLLADSRRCIDRDLEEMVSYSNQPRSARDYFEWICSKFRCWPQPEDVHYAFAVTGYLEYLTTTSMMRKLEDGRYIATSGVTHA